ncbi:MULTISPECIES: ICEBs1 excisionase [Bacillus]|uniref:ICEBs1 excisionase n=2 Tax=Bacillus subtilis TaxID=1423 RepID=A0AAX3RKE3_BACIU|nr:MULTISPECIES: ICEBs1 excisionase [Bacillus amyloliquefaciens group]MED3603441.1 ICEBs1 excisionase [Bacillus subtilis]MEC0385250.1 ICEBs1 excisionase [Bacillus velezensis]MEC0389727.1 ICEBs1 excisionase [Bacillus velezensis]MED3694274.1 ICEBs1 excisionase [Bacillus subtilis]NRF33616.1 ICEBs1 excisionase [Bacillus velezensis]
MKQFLTAKDIQDILGVKQAKSYEIIRQLNAEMLREGYKVIRGRVNKQIFEKRYFYESNESKTG